MPDTKTQLTGGIFQDPNGTVLANGYLIFELSQDSKVVDSNTEICSGVHIKITLNSSGSVDTTTPQYVWGNDDLSPINSYYTVTGYTANGQLAWGPNTQQVISGATFDVGTWIPNLLTNWTPPLQAPLIETNGVVNGLQSLLNLINGTNVSIVDNGLGGITINATAAPIALKHGGASNSSQTILDLTAGNNITITDSGSGVINIAETSTPYDLGIPIVGSPNAAETIGYIFPRSVLFAANFTDSYATSGAASAGTAVFTVKKNGSSVGTVTFTSSATGVFATSGSVSFVAGDLFQLVCPNPADASWSDGRFTFVGTR